MPLIATYGQTKIYQKTKNKIYLSRTISKLIAGFIPEERIIQQYLSTYVDPAKLR